MLLQSTKDITLRTTSTNSTAGDINFKSYNTTIMHVDGGNNRVGIGTTSPDNPLEVVGADSGIKISSGSSARPHLRFECGSDEKLRLSANTVYGAIGDASDANRYMAFKDGNVGIGTTSPQELLHVYHGSTSAVIRVSGEGNVNRKAEIGYNASAGPYVAAGSSGIATLKFYVDNTSLAMTIAQNDVISGDFNDTSDVALKENITDLESATTKLKQLKPRTFDWKKTDKENGVAGFIAQEVETVIPKAVVGTNYENSGDSGKAINTTALLAYAIKTIQELEARLTAGGL
jgi:hypothetical protein